jgi:hypothetical protein
MKRTISTGPDGDLERAMDALAKARRAEAEEPAD